jgi:hypothetical protein|tara:strand:- start:1172 stop:1333 length:162 start_codon:yes stop_codon:yes gene_type:complete
MKKLKRNNELEGANKKLKSYNKDTRLKIAERGYRLRLISKEEEDKLYNGKRYS